MRKEIIELVYFFVPIVGVVVGYIVKEAAEPAVEPAVAPKNKGKTNLKKRNKPCICDERLHVLVCRRCGKVHDITIPALTDETFSIYNECIRCCKCGALMDVRYGIPISERSEYQ